MNANAHRNLTFTQRQFYDRAAAAHSKVLHQPNVCKELAALKRAILVDNPWLLLELVQTPAVYAESDDDGTLHEAYRAVLKSKRLLPLALEWLDARTAAHRAEMQRKKEAAAIVAALKAAAHVRAELEKLNTTGTVLGRSFGSSPALLALKAQMHR